MKNVLFIPFYKDERDDYGESILYRIISTAMPNRFIINSGTESAIPYFNENP